MKSIRARRPRREIDNVDFLVMVSRLVAAAGRRVATGDVDDFRQLLELDHAVELAMVEAVRGMREVGTTWDEIGKVSGVTKQGAIRRWNHKL